MSNDVALFKNAGLPVKDITQFQKMLANAQANIAVKDGGNFLKLSKHSGEWIYGADETDVQEGSLWAINPGSLQMGYIAWAQKGGEVLGKRLLPILSGQTVERSSLPNVGAEWDECISMELKCMNGDDEGTQVIYEQNSYGSKKAFSKVLSEIVAQAGRDPVNFVPVVTMKSESYQHKTYGKIWNPIFDIVKWVSMMGEEGDSSDDTSGSAETGPEAPQPAPEPPKAAEKKKRAAVGDAAPKMQTAAPQAPAPAPSVPPTGVVRQRRRPVSA
jgi:hypothetical protein